MEVRPIDGNILRKWCEKIIDQACHPATVQIGEVFLDKVRSMPTLTPPNEWVSVEDAVPDPGVRVLAANGNFVGEAYMASNGAWMRHDGFPWKADAWIPLPEPPDRRPPEGEEAP